MKRGLASICQQASAHDIQRFTFVTAFFFDRGAQACDGHGPGQCPGKIGAATCLVHHRFHDVGQLGVLAVMNVIGLGGREQDPFNPPPGQRA